MLRYRRWVINLLLRTDAETDVGVVSAATMCQVPPGSDGAGAFGPAPV